jgi:predicted PurR-regulated permease PerM
MAAVSIFCSFLVPVLRTHHQLYAGRLQTPGAPCRLRQSPQYSLAIVLLVLVIPFNWPSATKSLISRVAGRGDRQGILLPDSLWVAFVDNGWLKLAPIFSNIASQRNHQFLSGEHVGNISRWVLATGRGAFDLLLTVLFIMITLFFVYKDGAKMVEQLDRIGERVLPLRWHRFSRVVPATVSSTVTGMTLIAIGEGIVLGIAYRIAGVPSSFLLGVLTGFMAMIPGGAPLSVALVSLYLVASPSLPFGHSHGSD